ncbi:centriole, cilia and spindle-associated protein isoform X1 [Synchiropus splendidus]|uniref:centriole, cilia and spindle-associated protein isoform X1 n=1 Tax=Synchiropus splendidus TaxID=270530 RepID=UPI00237D41CE|nr:centriole, cilia and spindle-associated protein isoform X1 [Synchiropus splendidus]XP_053720856.1 centriole, cilia and spindle-associated protein isoform X1 [Synchiropus splendidus]XP_053720857.1 centriole, cilia and spindle-associated protein isoform X1 [Synchiropus splendidus]
MVTKRIRSEYMKKFKDPKWETYSRCYEEMLKYRLTRRLLEQAHHPWFWSGLDSDSDSSGQSPPDRKQVHPCAEPPAEQTQEGAQIPLPEEPHGNCSHGDGVAELNSRKEELNAAAHTEPQPAVEDPGGGPQQPTKLPKQRPRRPQQVRPALSRPSRDHSTEARHPFVLYGAGEKHSDIAGRKTHNVGPAASTNEIHESALRAKTRREVERQIQTQRTERRRSKSAHPDQAKKVVQLEYNPWITEYMRCFSARSR